MLRSGPACVMLLAMRIELATPALLFPAVSLLLLAYTNRFLAISSLVRGLHARYQTSRDRVLVSQIHNLRLRLSLIKNMQALGVTSLFVCVVCMFVLFAGSQAAGKVLFGLSLLLLMASLALSVREIQLSTGALNIQLADLEGERSGWASVGGGPEGGNATGPRGQSPAP